MTEAILSALARDDVEGVEEQFMAALQAESPDWEGLAGVLDRVRERFPEEVVGLLAWSAAAEAGERLDAEEAYRVAASLLLRAEQSRELREQVVALYRRAFGGRAEAEALLRASGLADGTRTARRALRTLEVGLHAQRGAYLVSRTDESVVRVAEADAGVGSYTIEDGRRRRVVSLDELTADYAPVEADDFRVLVAFAPERLAALAREEPADLVVRVLRARGGEVDTHTLEHLLTPVPVPAEEWSKWWSRVRTALKRNPYVRMEGRSPVRLILDTRPVSLEEELADEVRAARTVGAVLKVWQTYQRECRARQQGVKAEFARLLIERLAERVGRSGRAGGRSGADAGREGAEAMAAAVLMAEIAESAGVALPESCEPGVVAASQADPLAGVWLLGDPGPGRRGLEAVRRGVGERWVGLFVQHLPRAPEWACALLAEMLVEAGHAERVNAVLPLVVEDPFHHAGAIAWLWKGRGVPEGLAVPPRVTLLSRMLNGLAELQRREVVPKSEARQIRSVYRSALTGAREAFAACLAEMDEPMGSAVRRQIERIDALTEGQREDLLEMLRRRFPRLWAKPKVPPWADPDTIYVTARGLARREEEIDHLINVEMAENARAIGEAASHGDLSENAEFRFALEARDMLRARLAAMQDQLLKARVLEPGDVPTDHVSVGSRVTLRERASGQTRVMTFLGPWEADVEAGVYNYQAPVSQQVMGRRVGDVVRLELEDGGGEYEIVRIECGI